MGRADDDNVMSSLHGLGQYDAVPLRRISS